MTILVLLLGLGAVVWRPWEDSASTAEEKVASTPSVTPAPASEQPTSSTSALAPATTRPSASGTSVPVPSAASSAAVAPSPSGTPLLTTAGPTIPAVPTAVPTSVVGDLGLGTPIANLGCTGEYVVLVRSSVEPSTYVADMTTTLAALDARYLLASASCSAFAPSYAGNPIYVGYLGPFADAASACTARSAAGGDSYVKVLDATTPDDALVECP